MAEPDNGEVIKQVSETVSETVQASNENTAYILNSIKDVRTDLIERVDTASKGIRDDFGKHEGRDQERFSAIATDLGAIKVDAAQVKVELKKTQDWEATVLEGIKSKKARGDRLTGLIVGAVASGAVLLAVAALTKFVS